MENTQTEKVKKKKPRDTRIIDAKIARKKKMMIQALEATLGVVAPAMVMAKVNRRDHYDYLASDPKYAAAVEDQIERTLDFAETNLYKQIEAGQVQATIFYLKSKGKHRGYQEQTTIDHTSSDGSMKPTIIELVPQPDLVIEHQAPEDAEIMPIKDKREILE